jgi:hypothetical protein
LTKKDNQITGNIGLYLVCYELSKRGWNVLPTSRNAKGIDIVAYTQDATKTITIQVKSLSKKTHVPFGKKIDNKLIADYIVICNDLTSSNPRIFITTTKEIKKKIHSNGVGKKLAYWLNEKKYRDYEDNWDLIGNGF